MQGAGGRAAAYAGVADAFARIARAEGLRGFYRGFGALVLTVVPANASYFSAYELGKRAAPAHWPGPARDLVTAGFAQTVAGVVFCPIDIVKQRVQTAAVMALPVPGAGGGGAAGGGASGAAGAAGAAAGSGARLAASARPAHLTPLAAARGVWAAHGLAGFYRGYLPMNALWMPWNLAYITLYEAGKRRVLRWHLARGAGAGAGAGAPPAARGGVAVVPAAALPAWAFPLCSSAAAAAAALATHPLDVVKTRLQVLGAAEPGRRRSALAVAAELRAAEGLKGFARGLGPRVATLSLGSSVSWCVYELAKRQLAARERGGDAADDF